MNAIKTFWRGDMPLWKAYWLYGWLGFTLLAKMFDALDRTLPQPWTPATAWSMLPFLLFACTYLIIIWVCIWRASIRYEKNNGFWLWAYLARGNLVLAVLYGIVESMT